MIITKRNVIRTVCVSAFMCINIYINDFKGKKVAQSKVNHIHSIF